VRDWNRRRVGMRIRFDRPIIQTMEIVSVPADRSKYTVLEASSRLSIDSLCSSFLHNGLPVKHKNVCFVGTCRAIHFLTWMRSITVVTFDVVVAAER
jgi:hypothetical protein